MLNTIEYILLINYAPAIGIFFMLAFLLFGHRGNKRINTIFSLFLILELIQLVSYSIEFITSSIAEFEGLNSLALTISYLIRPIFPFFFALIVSRSEYSRKRTQFLLFPFTVNAVISVLPLFLSKFPHIIELSRSLVDIAYRIIMVIYLLYIAIYLAKNSKKFQKIEIIIVSIGIATTFLSLAIKDIFLMKSIGITTVVICSLFYYMYFQAVFYSKEMEANEIKAQKLRQESELDLLTGLYNKVTFVKKTDEFLRYNNISSSMIFFDLDHFKEFNDTQGHLAGDELLKAVAKILKSTFRATDFIGRFGGDEFCVFMANVNYEFAHKKAEHLLQSLQIPIPNDNTIVTASIGIAYLEENLKVTCQDMLDTADKALYNSKKNGRNCYTLERVCESKSPDEREKNENETEQKILNLFDKNKDL